MPPPGLRLYSSISRLITPVSCHIHIHIYICVVICVVEGSYKCLNSCFVTAPTIFQLYSDLIFCTPAPACLKTLAPSGLCLFNACSDFLFCHCHNYLLAICWSYICQFIHVSIVSKHVWLISFSCVSVHRHHTCP